MTGGAASMPRIALVATGGTIGMGGAHRLDLVTYGQTSIRFSAARLLERIPETRALADVVAVDFGSFRSLSPLKLAKLSLLLKELLEREAFDGAVVTHGTNTLEESAYFLDRTVDVRKPVVIVGSMRPPNAMSSDADLNLVAALRAAAAPAVAAAGPVVCLNDTLYAARDAVKASTYRLHAFQAPGYGPIGYVDADGSVVLRHLPRRADVTFDVSAVDELPRVEVVASYPGADGAIVRGAVDAGAHGIVMAGTGAGTREPAEDRALDEAVDRGVAVAVSTRVASGRVVATRALRERGLVATGDLGPWKARILLLLALTRTRDAAELQRTSTIPERAWTQVR